MDKPKIILIGGGGHCKSCIDVIEAEGKYSIDGIIDLPEKVGEKILGYSIIGTDNDLDDLAKNYDNFLITLGQLESPVIRIDLYNKIKSLNKSLPVIISPSAYVSSHSTIGEGSIIMHQAIINAGSSVGNNCIINSRALIEHDSKIGNHCHVSTAAVINGGCEISNNVFIGSGTNIIQEISIASDSIIGAGTVVTKNLNTGKYIGNPLKQL